MSSLLFVDSWLAVSNLLRSFS